MYKLRIREVKSASREKREEKKKKVTYSKITRFWEDSEHTSRASYKAVNEKPKKKKNYECTDTHTRTHTHIVRRCYVPKYVYCHTVTGSFFFGKQSTFGDTL